MAYIHVGTFQLNDERLNPRAAYEQWKRIQEGPRMQETYFHIDAIGAETKVGLKIDLKEHPRRAWHI
jgi:hypothetical protein